MDRRLARPSCIDETRSHDSPHVVRLTCFCLGIKGTLDLFESAGEVWNHLTGELNETYITELTCPNFCCTDLLSIVHFNPYNLYTPDDGLLKTIVCRPIFILNDAMGIFYQI